MTDFFISYTHADTQWAEWIAHVLEEQGLTTIIQAWDFRPGTNFVIAMQNAAAQADRTIMVLSADYLQSQFASPEWAAAFSHDPQGLKHKLVPVLVRPCQPTGMLGPLVQIRLVDMDEQRATATLLAGIDSKRAKPASRPSFPGAVATAEPKEFPGRQSPPVEKRPATVIPGIKKSYTDLDKRRFAKEGFQKIRELFEANLQAAAAEEPRLQGEFEPQTSVMFSAEIFRDGKSACACRIWLGGYGNGLDAILYAQGAHGGDNGYNEMLSVDTSNGISLSATMAMGFTDYERSVDIKHMSVDQAADYLWQRFISPLSY